MTDTERHPDPDIHKGAIEGPSSDGTSQGNRNAPAIGEDGLPNDDVAIAEDVLGANEDESEG